jgi:hypothetical protein
MEKYSQQKTLDMQRGLFLIKYEASDGSDHPPRVGITADAGSENAIELILPPDASEAVLWSPGASIVARAVRSGRLRVAIAAAEPNGSTAARVQVVTLSNDPGGVREPEVAEPLDLSEFRVLGHVAGRGDVIVEADNWVGGPMAPARIEGIAIQWPKQPRDLIFRYAVTVGGQRPAMGQFVGAGEFAGTKGRALPLVGATLEISGHGANGQQLVVESIFLGSPQMKVVGRRAVLAGPTGREPLVGLRVRIEPVEQQKSVRQTTEASALRQDEPVVDGRAVRESTSSPGVARKGKPNRGGATPPPLRKRTGEVHVFRGGSSAKKPPTGSKAAAERDVKPSPSSTPAPPPAKKSGRVRVFRSSSQRKQSQNAPELFEYGDRPNEIPDVS